MAVRGRSATTGAVAVVLLLAGCAGGTGAPAATAPAGTASASPAMGPSAAAEKPSRMPREQVEADFLFATEGMGAEALRFVRRGDAHMDSCMIDGVLATPEVGGKAELLKIVEKLRLRGWRSDAVVEADEEGMQTLAKGGGWTMYIGVAPVPEQAKAQAGANKGALAVGGMAETCGAQ
ncbi:hypothetical protein [Streptomyces thermolilacinus]|uniref:hypothetical protein n=1 Tax=Streptomyces thermolilacinus TaxID=285540 RepID=UPI0033D07133